VTVYQANGWLGVRRKNGLVSNSETTIEHTRPKNCLPDCKVIKKLEEELPEKIRKL